MMEHGRQLIDVLPKFRESVLALRDKLGRNTFPENPHMYKMQELKSRVF